jgi:predicted HTH transcriptional regulator
VPRQGWIARRLDYGTLVVGNSDFDDAVHVKDIPNPAHYVGLILRLVDAPAFEPKSAQNLITSGENQYVEFKSSLMWDYRRQTANKDLYEPVMKNIAAFMNTRGGAVLIGVGDEGAVLGLEPDLKTLRKQDVDGFENVFNMAFNKMIGVEFRRYVDVGFPQIDGKTICVVTAQPSVHPAYLVHKGTEKFYIRTGNSSQPLSVSKAAQYIQTHFNS